MKVKAKDQLHISAVKSGIIATGEEFEVGDAEGQLLVERGLVERVKEKREAKTAAKKASPPKNKRAAKPKNKAVAAAPANKSK